MTKQECSESIIAQHGSCSGWSCNDCGFDREGCAKFAGGDPVEFRAYRLRIAKDYLCGGEWHGA